MISWSGRSRRGKRLRAGLADVDVISLDPRAGWLSVAAVIIARQLEAGEAPESLTVLTARPDGTRVLWTLQATEGPGIGSLEYTVMAPVPDAPGELLDGEGL